MQIVLWSYSLSNSRVDKNIWEVTIVEIFIINIITWDFWQIYLMNKQRIENIPGLLVDRTMYFWNLEMIMLKTCCIILSCFVGSLSLKNMHMAYPYMTTYLIILMSLIFVRSTQKGYNNLPLEQWDTRVMYLFPQ